MRPDVADAAAASAAAVTILRCCLKCWGPRRRGPRRVPCGDPDAPTTARPSRSDRRGDARCRPDMCRAMAFLLERHSQETDIKTVGGADAFWTTTQLLTVSSQIKNPYSQAGGRLLRRLHGVWAITVIATLAGAVGGFLQERGQEDRRKALTRGLRSVSVRGPARPPIRSRPALARAPSRAEAKAPRSRGFSIWGAEI